MTTIPGTEHFSAQKLELLHLLFDFPPTRLAAAVSIMRRFLERQRAGMPIEEAARLMWQEAVDDGSVPIHAVPPDVRIQTPCLRGIRCRRAEVQRPAPGERVALTAVQADPGRPVNGGGS